MIETKVIDQMPWVYAVPWDPADESHKDALVSREWLVTNGLGGYASGSVSGVCTRRYHGLLVAALPAPLGRMVMLTQLSEETRLPGGRVVRLSGQEHPGDPLTLDWLRYLTEFRLEMGTPVWRFEIGDFVLEKRLVLPYRQNTAHISYSLVEGKGVLRLRLRPYLHFRPHESKVDSPLSTPYRVIADGDRMEVCSRDTHPEYREAGILPPLRLASRFRTGAFILDGGRFEEVFYRTEYSRGYESKGSLWTPGYFRFNMEKGDQATVVASTEEWDTILALEPGEADAAEQERRRRLLDTADPRARGGAAAQLVLAADQFIIAPNTRLADVARAQASGDEFRTVIAGYHWFTDWGRDTMISLEGLTLTTGRQAEAGYILRTFAHYIKYGLIPNMFPEGEREGLYHTADATFWYFHALDRYIKASGDQHTLRVLLPKLLDIFEHHLNGTRFGIGMDPADSLIRQGEEGYQLTWMDAKVADWVVTPRRGKAVEINALWYNALRLLEQWLEEADQPHTASRVRETADKTYESFNRRFWNEEKGYLFDLVDGETGDDPCLRPNQILALSLNHPVLAPQRWKPVLDAVTANLLTPVGLRSLGPHERDYKLKYDGDLRARDAAYHQGTVWAWLIGPFIDAWLRVHQGDKQTARRFLDGFMPHLHEAGVGSISEIFDAEEPFVPRGCVAQAWSVAEVLRCLVLTDTSTD